MLLNFEVDFTPAICEDEEGMEWEERWWVGITARFSKGLASDLKG
jgi:hypothetical protein